MSLDAYPPVHQGAFFYAVNSLLLRAKYGTTW